MVVFRDMGVLTGDEQVLFLYYKRALWYKTGEIEGHWGHQRKRYRQGIRIEKKGKMAMGGTHGERGRNRDHNHCFFVSVCMQRETEKHGFGAERQG